MADALIVEFKQRFVVHEDVATTGFVLQLFHFGAQLKVFAEEGVASLPVAFHQRMADKQLAGERRIDQAVVHLTRRHDRQAVNGHFFRRHYRALRALPVRFTVRAFQQVLRDRFDPLRIDTCRNASPQTAGFDQFGHDSPFRRFLE
ncbi:hypothetical protein D3C72_809140 [compost metagenome]